MAKREDWKHIKTLAKFYNWEQDTIAKYCATPLVVNDNLDFNKLPDDIREQHNQEAGLLSLYYHPDLFPVKEFLFLDKLNVIETPHKNGVFFKYNYFYVEIMNDFSYITYFTKTKGLVFTRYLLGASKIQTLYSIDGQTMGLNDEQAEFMEYLLIRVTFFFKALTESDLYPVEKTGTNKKHRPHIKHDKKPWERGDLSSIVFLNKLPTVQEQSESKGGHHASPRFHHRRGTWVHLKNERYKNHPKFGDKIYRKASWVGEREAIVNGTTYKVL